MGEVDTSSEHWFENTPLSRNHRSVLVYKPTDDTVQLVIGRHEAFPEEYHCVHDIRNHVINASNSSEDILINEFKQVHGHALYAIQGEFPRDGCLNVFLVVPGVTEPCLFIAPADITETEIVDAVARDCDNNAENLILFFDGKRLDTLTNLVLGPLEMLQVVEKKAVTITLEIHEKWQKEMTKELPVPTTATTSDVVKQLRESDECVQFDENKYSVYISAGFSCYGENDFPFMDVVDRNGNFFHEKMNTTSFVLHQVPKDEKLECMKVRMLKNDDWVDTVILLPQNSLVGDLRCELAKMLSCPGNSLRIAMGREDKVLHHLQNVPLVELLHGFRGREEDALIFFAKPEADMKVTVAIESPKKVNTSTRYHFYARRYDPAAVVHKAVAEETKCDPGLVHISHQGNSLSDYALLCQCLEDPQDGCELRAIILEEGTTLRFLHKTRLCCKVLVEDTTRSTVADLERLVETIHLYCKGSVTIYKEGLPLDRELTISKAGLKMQDALLVTIRDQANALRDLPAPFNVVFETGQDGVTRQRFAIMVNGIPCYVPDGVDKAELAGCQEEETVGSEPVPGIHILSKIRHGAHHDSSHAASTKSCHHASEYYRRTSCEDATKKEKEPSSQVKWRQTPTTQSLDKKTKPKRPSAKISKGKFNWSNPICAKEDTYEQMIKEDCGTPEDESAPTVHATASEKDLISDREVDVYQPKSECDQQLVNNLFQQIPTVRVRKTYEMVTNCSQDQLLTVLNRVDAESSHHGAEENSVLPIAGSQRGKDPLSKTLEDIAKELGHDWPPVCRDLGLFEKDINEIEVMYPKDLSRQALAGLIKWKHRSGKGANVSTLKHWLLKNGRSDLAETLCVDDKEEGTDMPP